MLSIYSIRKVERQLEMDNFINIFFIVLLVIYAFFLEFIKKYDVSLSPEKRREELHKIAEYFPGNTKYIVGYKIDQKHIDLIAINEYGITVVKTINFKGQIKGNELGDTWSSIPEDRELLFDNPVIENDELINKLSQRLGYSYNYYSLIYFINDVELDVSYNKGQDLFVATPASLAVVAQEICQKEKCLSEAQTRNLKDKLLNGK